MPMLLNKGEKCQPINMTDGPSKKFMRRFYSRCPSLKRRSAEYVDCGHINVANKDTRTDCFTLLLETLVILLLNLIPMVRLYRHQ